MFHIFLTTPRNFNKIKRSILLIMSVKYCYFFNQVFNFWFPLNNFSLLWPIDTKHAVLVAYIMGQLGIANQMSVIKVKVTVTKIEI